jgi:MFS family permease
MTTTTAANRRYSLFLLMVAGLGGLLYGVDVGIIGGALPYLEATSKLTPGELSVIVAAVLLGSVISTLFAGNARRLARPQAAHGHQRPQLPHQHPGHRPLQRL